ncbi:hypothetical protein Leryth_007128 [Lithospermum erythrorhizon]|nr:hypothetical protein Leryth_007128 [Lithospermum erythrorhizon]
MNFGDFLDSGGGGGGGGGGGSLRLVGDIAYSNSLPTSAITQQHLVSHSLDKPTMHFNTPGLSLALQTSLEGQGEMARMGGNYGSNHNSTSTVSLVRSRDDEHESRSGSDHMEGASGDELDATDGRPPKKKRYHRHTPQQIQELESLFKKCPHPDDKQRLELSRRLCLDPRQVKFWFQNRRTQMKTQLERHENSILRQENEKLRVENMIENARLKDELDRVCALAGKFLGYSGIRMRYHEGNSVLALVCLLSGTLVETLMDSAAEDFLLAVLCKICLMAMLNLDLPMSDMHTYMMEYSFIIHLMYALQLYLEEEEHAEASSSYDGQLLCGSLMTPRSVWLPISPRRLFNFLRDEGLRSEWDILSNGGPMQEMARIAKGQDHGNSVSLLRATAMNSNQNSMLILQETSSDASGSVVVYAPVDIPAMHLVMNGGDSDYVALLPSGFAIVPDGPGSGLGGPVSNGDLISGGPMRGRGGSLLTVGFQILVNSLPTGKLTVESVETLNNLISCTVQKIKAALNCET